MYYGRKAEPKASKITYQRDVERNYELHRRRLQKIKPSVDNKPPKQCKHLRRNLKKEQMLEERYAKIEHENRVLLQKMSEIMQSDGLDNINEEQQYGHSMNRTQRKRELQKITRENQQILRRIQQTMPMYNHWEWERDREYQERLVNNICEYQPSITTKSSLLGGRSSTMSKSQGSLAQRSSLAGIGASVTSQGDGHGYSSTGGMPKSGGHTASHGQLPSGKGAGTGGGSHQPSNILGSSYSHGMSSSHGMSVSASQPSLFQSGSQGGT
eukprot:gb/GECG01009198.1/.p1 GENE.gb/GECG01009198.1/~~gb/GECG01009198.1/.p1  ORF type:complete len:269 (+),score=34.20 gb/GECG01009198.1/:1-807(+)